MALNQVRTSEDHNGDGTGVPPFPQACTEYSRSNFELAGDDLRITHTLAPGTALMAVRFERSDKCKLYGTEGDPETGIYTRFVSDTTTGHSTLNEAERDINFKVTNFDAPDAAASEFEIIVWEW